MTPPELSAPLAPGPARPSAPAVRPVRRIRFAWVVFCFGFLLFGLGRMAQAVAPALMRSEPTEIDDAYRYLAQAHVMAACFAGDCPALQSIEEQLELGAGDRRSPSIVCAPTSTYSPTSIRSSRWHLTDSAPLAWVPHQPSPSSRQAWA